MLDIQTQARLYGVISDQFCKVCEYLWTLVTPCMYK